MVPKSDEDSARYNASKECCICHNSARPFIIDDPQWRKVAGHDHVTGFIIGSAHDLCNRLRQFTFEIPVFFYNFRGYDNYMILQLFIKHRKLIIK